MRSSFSTSSVSSTYGQIVEGSEAASSLSAVDRSRSRRSPPRRSRGSDWEHRSLRRRRTEPPPAAMRQRRRLWFIGPDPFDHPPARCTSLASRPPSRWSPDDVLVDGGVDLCRGSALLQPLPQFLPDSVASSLEGWVGSGRPPRTRSATTDRAPNGNETETPKIHGRAPAALRRPGRKKDQWVKVAGVKSEMALLFFFENCALHA